MESAVQWLAYSTEWIIDQVRTRRNELVKTFLDDRIIENHFREFYSVETVRPVKVEFLKRDLRSLLISPVDLAYYAGLIKEVKESRDLQKMDEPAYHKLFVEEIDIIFRKYSY